MKRSTCLGLGTTLVLLVSICAAAQPAQPGPTVPDATNAAAAPAAAEDPAAAARRQLQQDVDQARQRVEKLMRQLQATSAAQIETVLDNQRRLEALAGTALGLLALTVLLSSAGLVLALQQRRALLSLVREERGRGAEIPAAPVSEAGSGPGEGASGDRPSTPGAGAAATAGSPAPPAQDAGQIAAASEEDGEAAPLLPPGMRHREVALLLARLCREAPRLAERFASSELRERFRKELDAPVHARLDRLIALSGQDDGLLQERWLGPDLVTTLDALARFYSAAVAEERNGHDTGLARDLHRWLYDAFGDACRDEGWFAIDPIEPYKTKFNPQIHCAVAGRDVDGAEGQIIAIKSIGRRDARTGAVKHQAEVIVGR